MGARKYVIAGGIVAVVASAALLVPSLALGQPISTMLPGVTSVQDADGPGHGQGKAWGHHKGSAAFPGQGKGLDKSSPNFPGQGKGLEKSSPDFPGKGKGHGKEHGNPHSDD